MKDKKFRKYMRLARKVQNLADKYRQLSDQELQMQTILFRQQLELGKKVREYTPTSLCCSCRSRPSCLRNGTLFCPNSWRDCSFLWQCC